MHIDFFSFPYKFRYMIEDVISINLKNWPLLGNSTNIDVVRNYKNSYLYTTYTDTLKKTKMGF